MKIKFKLQEGESLITQGSNELHIVGKGVNTYLWIGGKGCYGTLSGMKTLESLAANIYRALGHEPMWLHLEKIKAAEKIIKSKRKK
jgi:hypothetical protein